MSGISIASLELPQRRTVDKQMDELIGLEREALALLKKVYDNQRANNASLAATMKVQRGQ